MALVSTDEDFWWRLSAFWSLLRSGYEGAHAVLPTHAFDQVDLFVSLHKRTDKVTRLLYRAKLGEATERSARWRKVFDPRALLTQAEHLLGQLREMATAAYKKAGVETLHVFERKIVLLLGNLSQLQERIARPVAA